MGLTKLVQQQQASSLPAGQPKAQSAQNGIQFAQALGTAIAQGMAGQNTQNGQGVFDLRGGQVVNTYVIPPTMNWSATSTQGTGATNQTMYIFNEGDQGGYNTSPTTNGYEAGSITKNYGDGFSGRLYNNLFKFPGDTIGKGIKIYGFNIIFTNASTGVQDPVGLQQANLQWNVYNGYTGRSVPETLDMNQALRNTQYQNGLLTFEWEAYLNEIGQFSVNLPAGDTISMSFFTQPLM